MRQPQMPLPPHPALSRQGRGSIDIARLRARRARLRLSGHRHERDRQQLFALDPRRGVGEDDQFLQRFPQRQNYAPAGCELIQQGLGNMFRGRRENDRVKGRLLRPTLIPVARPAGNAGNAQPVKRLVRALGQLLDNLNREYPYPNLCQHGGLIPRPRSDFQHAFLVVEA